MLTDDDGKKTIKKKTAKKNPKCFFDRQLKLAGLSIAGVKLL